MSDTHDVEQFPALVTKLAAPKKESLYQRQKQEAEAKRLREEAENAAALESFVKSLDDEDSRQTSTTSGGTMTSMGSHRGARGGPNRHFTPSAKKSGPGTLGPTAASTRKRPFTGPEPPRKHSKGSLGFEDEQMKDLDDDEDNQDIRANVPKPTIQMNFLPPGTSVAVIKSLLPDTLTVEAVRVQTPPANSINRKSQSAVISLSTNTPIAAVDAAITGLQNRYLGWGFYLSLSRGLSSTALSSTLNSNALSSGILPQSSLPFGARSREPHLVSSRNAPPPSSHHNGRFAPPTSYSAPSGPATQVYITPPSSIARIRLIHKTVEAILTHGPEFEALLMTRPSVQRDEKWAWLWDSRSTDGVWYRWRIWELMTGLRSSKGAAKLGNGRARLVFEGGAPWVEPLDGDLPFEFTTRLEHIVHEHEYDSSEEDDSGDESGLPRLQQRDKRQRYNTSGGPPDTSMPFTGTEEEESTYLNPLHRAKLVHLLTRLPTSTAKLRIGDVARLTAFAITHAGAGAEEVCNLLSLNVLQPLCLQKQLTSISSEDEGHTGDSATVGKSDDDDLSQPTLVALRVVSDLLSASSASGVRHAWRYRQLLHASIVRYRVFRHLGRMEREISSHSRIRAEKWRRSITQGILALWEKWGVFLGPEMDHFVEEFEISSTDGNTAAEKAAGIEKQERDKKLSRWRNVEDRTSSALSDVGPVDMNKSGDDFNEPHLGEDIDGQPMEEDDLESDLDGVPMDDSDEELSGATQQPNVAQNTNATRPVGNFRADISKVSMQLGSGHGTANVRQRPRAVDMFADSEDDGTL